METGSHHCGPGDGCPLAPIWVCNVLASNFQRPPDSGPEKDFPGSPRSDLSDGRGELHVGRPTYSRRTPHARFRYLGTNDSPLDETSAERPGASKTLACFSSQSPGRHRGDGPLYRSDHHLRCALLLLHHRPRSEAYRELQRYVPSDRRGLTGRRLGKLRRVDPHIWIDFGHIVFRPSRQSVRGIPRCGVLSVPISAAVRIKGRSRG